MKKKRISFRIRTNKKFCKFCKIWVNLNKQNKYRHIILNFIIPKNRKPAEWREKNDQQISIYWNKWTGVSSLLLHRSFDVEDIHIPSVVSPFVSYVFKICDPYGINNLSIWIFKIKSNKKRPKIVMLKKMLGLLIELILIQWKWALILLVSAYFK